jgi:peptidyl-prolyl cis-trans isomerase SurA
MAQAAREQLIEGALKRSAAEAQGLSLPEGALDQAIADFAAQRNASVAAVEAALRRVGASREALEYALGTDLLWREAVRGRYAARATPSEAEIDQEIALAAEGRAASYRLLEIGLPFGARGEASTRELAARLVRELRGGASFAAAARRHSASPSARQGGDVGWIPERALPPEAAAAIAGLSVGDVSDPIPIPGGLTIVKVEDLRTEAAPWAQPATIDLLEIRGADAEPLEETVRDAAASAASCARVVEVVSAVGLSAERRDGVDSSTLAPEVRAAVGALDPVLPSEVVETARGPAIYMVCSRSGGPDTAARDALRQQIRQQRLQNFAAAYLQELEAEAVIELR